MGAISLAVNGVVRQSSDLEKMIWSVAEQISELSEAFELKAGGIIYSGTPENVGPVAKGDVRLCKLEGLPDFHRYHPDGSSLAGVPSADCPLLGHKQTSCCHI